MAGNEPISPDPVGHVSINPIEKRGQEYVDILTAMGGGDAW